LISLKISAGVDGIVGTPMQWISVQPATRRLDLSVPTGEWVEAANASALGP